MITRALTWRLRLAKISKTGRSKSGLSVFTRYGLPNRILCDNGPPWGGAEAACPYTEFGVWLLRLGVELIHGRAYHPQTQGKEERFHRSMQAEVLNQTTAWRHLAHCQSASMSSETVTIPSGPTRRLRFGCRLVAINLAC